MREELGNDSPATVVVEVSGSAASEHLVRTLTDDMRSRWQRGEQPRAEDFLASHPELWSQPEAAVDVIYEEFCLRHAAGQTGAAEDVLRRFPQWAAPLRVMLDCHRLLDTGTEAGGETTLPDVGDSVGEFRLLELLGTGLQGRVFLATQPGLADRPVVVKVTPLIGREHLLLARLQHTNIVPLHTVFDDPVRRLRLIVMPYFGRVTLSSVLKAVANVPHDQRTGRHVGDALDRPTPNPVSAARQMLDRVSYVQAVCWLGSALADALQFAHERGLVHFDIKPANVLLAADGQPMLLDFHLARAPVLPDGPRPNGLGGSTRYMPPEQHDAMKALQMGHKLATTLDGRCDLFSLGVVLYEALGGPLPVKADSPALTTINSAVSVGLSDVIAKCLAQKPDDRYASAGALADDLRRHLTDQPLVGVSNRSLGERWRKWRRRRPATLRTAGLLAVAAAAAAMLAGGGLWMHRDRTRQAESAILDGRAHLAAGNREAEAAASFDRGLKLVERMPFAGDLPQRLQDDLGIARRRLLVRQLHRLADEVRGLYVMTSLSPERLRTLSQACRGVWEKRAELAALGGDEPSVNEDLQDVALFAAELEARSAGNPRRVLDEAESLLGPSAPIALERRRHTGSMALPEPFRTRSAREHYVIGRSLLAAGDVESASRELAAAVAGDPAGRWSNFYFGLCAGRREDHRAAVTAFSVCIGRDPENPWCFYNRGLSLAALDDHDAAKLDFDQALRLDPTLADAALSRGLSHWKRERNGEALADLDLALRLGSTPAVVRYNQALIHLDAGDTAAARDKLRLGLQADPNHLPSKTLAETLAKKT